MKLSNSFTTHLKFVFFSALISVIAGCSNQQGAASKTNATPIPTTPSAPSVSNQYERYLKSDYDIAFNLPSDWQISSVKVHPNGWAKFFAPKAQTDHAQSVIVHFFKDEKATPTQFVERAKQITARLNCKVDRYNIKEVQKDSVTFTVTNTQCETIHDLIQVFKIFEMPDGLYTISYKAKIKATSAQDISQMSAIVENAKIIKK